MVRRGDAWDRWALGAVVGLVTGCALWLWLLGADDAVGVALAARRERAAESSADARAMRGDVVAVPFEIEAEAAEVADASGPERVTRAAAEVTHEGADVARLVEALRDDDVPWNGTAAMRQLLRLPPGRLPELELALTSSDAQQRRYAAAVLRHRHLRDGGEPAAALLAASVAELRGDAPDRADRDVVGTLAASPRVASVRFLSRYAKHARSLLLRALDSFDAQERFFAAWLLAHAGIRDRAARCAFVLVEHLRDNDIAGDALLATNGLYRLGEPALPVMAQARRYADEQALQLLDLIELDLRSPPKDEKDLRARGYLHRITGLYHDPAIEFDVHRSVVPLLR